MTNQLLEKFDVDQAQAKGADDASQVCLSVQWQVEHAQVRLSGASGGVLTSVAWHVAGGAATAIATDADGKRVVVASGVPLRQTRAGRYVHADSSDGRLHLTVELTGKDSCKLMYIATDLLTTLGVAGGRAEWPVLVRNEAGSALIADSASSDR